MFALDTFLFCLDYWSAYPERLLRASALFSGMRLDEKRHPSLKADRGEAWNLWSQIISYLEEVVLTLKVFIYLER